MLDTDKNVDIILQERGEVYGDYAGGLAFRQALVDAIKGRYKQVHNKQMCDDDIMLFNDIIGKLSRLAVTPDHDDSWKDLAGYSLLVEEIIKGNKNGSQ